MRLRPTTRQFLLSAAAAAVFMVVVFGGRLMSLLPFISGGDRTTEHQFILIEASAFGVIFLLGMAIAWLGVVRDRKERAKRRAPLSL